MGKALTKQDIINLLKKNKDVLEKYKIREIALFGSYVRSEQTENSDIDLLVEFEKGATLFDIINLENFLSGIFGRRVSVVSRNGLNKYIGPHILKEAETIEKRL